MSNQREAFEKWADSKGLDLDREGESYYETDTHFSWSAWQAAQQAQWLPIESAPKEELKDLIVFNGESRQGQWWERLLD